MSSGFLAFALQAALVICASGLAWRVSRWLRADIGPDARSAAPLARAASVARATASALRGPYRWSVLGAFALDALLLRRLFGRDRLHAIAHHLAVLGFTWLLLVHALAPIVASRLSPGYQPTLDPWLFLRDLFGGLALAGVLVLGLRRRPPASGRRTRSVGELTFLALLVLVPVTGFLLEAQKMASPAAFSRMSDIYAAQAGPGERALLREWWAREFGVPYDHPDEPLDATSAARARALHEEACESCHAKPSSAFIAWPLSHGLAPLSRRLDAVGADMWLLQLHALACIVGLASLPFTRFFHAVASPFGLFLDAVARRGGPPVRRSSNAFVSTRRAVALDACVHCRRCDATCSVAPISRWLGNDALLPSRKLEVLGDIAFRRLPPFEKLDAMARRDALRVAEGAYLCTDCGRCTKTCPVGIDLADLWQAGRADFADAGVGPADRWIQARTPFAWGAAMRAAQNPDAQSRPLRLAGYRAALDRCIQCQACTNVCPVVACGTGGEVDLTPQQVMNLLRLGRVDLALGSRMPRACAGCYQCQEHCPEGIPVADILLELGATAPRVLGAVREREART